MADSSKDMPFKAVQIDALVRVLFQYRSPHYAPRYSALAHLHRRLSIEK